MTELLDARPAGLDALFRAGNTFTCKLTWPAGSLVGRTFTAQLDAAVLNVAVVGNEMTVTVSEAQTAAAGEPGAFTLTETTGGPTEVLIAGRWVPSSGAAATSSTAVTVTQGAATVEVGVVAVTAVGDLAVAGLLSLGKGIKDEGRSFASNELFTTASRIATAGLPRIVLPNGAPTSAFAGGVGLPVWWLTHGITIGFDIVNDHTASGNIVWRVRLRKYNSFGDVDTPTMALDSTEIIAGPAGNGGMMTVTHSAWVNVDITPDAFGSLYACEVQRIADSPFDTLEGPVGLTEVAFLRGSL